MARVRIITDVTAHLDPDIVKKYQITVLPITIRFGGEKFEITPGNGTERFFHQMAEGPAQIMRATISTQAFEQAYDRLSRETNDILVILSSSKLSNGFEQARTAAHLFLGRCRITVLDSMTASWGLRLMVKAAAQAAADGQPLDEIVRLARGMASHIYLVFFVERLDYLERGDRIGQAQALLGTMLHIKPLLLVEDGDIIPLEKVRTRTMAIEKLANFVVEFATIQQIVILASPLNGDMGTMVRNLQEQLSLALPGRSFPIIDYDPILACHLGPEALGVAVYEGF